TKGATDLLGYTIIYHGTTALDTLELDANGQANHVFEGLEFGEETFVLVYVGDEVYDPNDASLTVEVGLSNTAKATLSTFNMPETAEVHDEVVIDITVTTDEGNAVEYGQVYLMVDSIVKNAFEVDVLGTTSVTLPNLVKNSEISVFYLGDKMSYL